VSFLEQVNRGTFKTQSIVMLISTNRPEPQRHVTQYEAHYPLNGNTSSQPAGGPSTHPLITRVETKNFFTCGEGVSGNESRLTLASRCSEFC
jgi:hypothetical protein